MVLSKLRVSAGPPQCKSLRALCPEVSNPRPHPLTNCPVESKYYQEALIGKGGVMVLCPECENNLDFEEDDVDEGEVVSCPECGTDFEVITTSPLS